MKRQRERKRERRKEGVNEESRTEESGLAET